MGFVGIVVRRLIWLVGEEMKFVLGWNSTSTTDFGVCKCLKAGQYTQQTIINIIFKRFRSPLYDSWTRQVIFGLLIFTAKNVPFGTQISEVLFAYILHYRKVYSLLWAK